LFSAAAGLYLHSVSAKFAVPVARHRLVTSAAKGDHHVRRPTRVAVAQKEGSVPENTNRIKAFSHPVAG